MTAKVTTTVELKSDLTGKAATESRSFTFGGVTANLHLTDVEAAKLDRELGKYIAKAHEAVVDPSVLRVWATEQGLTVGARGRISAEVAEAYRASMGAGEPVKASTETAEVDSQA